MTTASRGNSVRLKAERLSRYERAPDAPGGEYVALHYVCDFCRRLLGGSFDRWHEEALAVAWEWQWLRSQDRWNSFYGLMHPTLRRIVVQAMFDHRAPGYRDWQQFASQTNFHDAVTAYLYPASAQTFVGTAFNFGAWAVAHVPDDANRAWDERAIRSRPRWKPSGLRV
ncbi:hypothetical protein [Candidatus Thiodictyon syntrophicum]|jgi:hypothetical protein|uniref:hypothetical protein n=1 Tax=Candidatus Thiodictyon syntrophicum TaxID=1166950 RepID=UPI001F3E4397|nr:hypothetical protein [Candidatus Thiodictyon syntrophicum]